MTTTRRRFQEIEIYVHEWLLGSICYTMRIGCVGDDKDKEAAAGRRLEMLRTGDWNYVRPHLRSGEVR